MSATLLIRDETPAGETAHEFSLEFLTETITVRELIRSRVYQEVQDYNVSQRLAGPYQGLVSPQGPEEILNGPRSKAGSSRIIDWKRSFERALQAFEEREVLILVNEKQVESLEQEITIRAGTQVTFLKLTLLVGG